MRSKKGGKKKQGASSTSKSTTETESAEMLQNQATNSERESEEIQVEATVECHSCKAKHNGKYGSGKYCSLRCSRAAGGQALRKKREKEFLQRVSKHSLSSLIKKPNHKQKQ
mmetsp:Transcript_3608/g.6316  ORF Transcript_3608/g.6316 Transcript_3608/m.6316 type:complete len:112 (-) Transcript_3608:157-492(-)